MTVHLCRNGCSLLDVMLDKGRIGKLFCVIQIHHAVPVHLGERLAPPVPQQIYAYKSNKDQPRKFLRHISLESTCRGPEMQTLLCYSTLGRYPGNVYLSDSPGFSGKILTY